ncbi:hypothetical protein MHU86_25397 [Fragilaria crotonensis]|nr:hypothetical protein MHU86_25397 [Fragilaria crotonensis]
MMRFIIIASTILYFTVSAGAFTTWGRRPSFLVECHGQASTSDSRLFASPANALVEALKTTEVTKTCKVTIGPSPSTGRLGLIATSNIKNGETVLAMPYDDMFSLTPDLARSVVFRDKLPEAYDGWTGDAGLIALLILNEVARVDQQGGIARPQRTAGVQSFMQAWVTSLPSPTETEQHPYMWSEEDQEILQSSSTNKIYRRLDDIEEDAAWLEERVWSKDRTAFPPFVKWNGDTIPCFNAQGYKWAMILATSGTFFTDGSLRLMPILDYANHDDKKGREVEGGTMGTFGTTRGAVLVAGAKYDAGEEVFCSYGPKALLITCLSMDFAHPRCGRQQSQNSLLNLTQKIVSTMTRWIFWNSKLTTRHLWIPSRRLTSFLTLVAMALDDLATCPEGGRDVCVQLREAETKALTKTMEFLKREEALDLKEYYQERRLKDLGLDSDWSPEDDMVDPELGFGQTRLPGGADYDW